MTPLNSKNIEGTNTMKLVQIESRTIVGYKVRTKNDREMEPATAKIGELWAKFTTDIAPNLGTDNVGYGVYTEYETDHTGAFDVLAGSTPYEGSKNAGLSQVVLAEGDYLVFSGVGELPQAVINVWSEQIWPYFDKNSCSHERAYTTDFELYKGAEAVDIYIAIKKQVTA